MLEVAAAIDTPPEWGIVGVIVGIVMLLIGTFLWWVRAARQDLRVSQKAFIDYLMTTGAHQNEALVATANELHRLSERQSLQGERQQAHETRAQARHEAMVMAMQAICRTHEGREV